VWLSSTGQLDGNEPARGYLEERLFSVQQNSNQVMGESRVDTPRKERLTDQITLIVLFPSDMVIAQKTFQNNSAGISSLSGQREIVALLQNRRR
jgi:hypothetical protein